MESNLDIKQFTTRYIKFIPAILILFCTLNLSAQQDTILKNTLRYNITNPVLFGSRSVIFGFERVVSRNQSFSVNIGRASFPKLLSGSSDSAKLGMGLETNYKDVGFNLSVDYRFYLRKLNKFGAPRGAYIGPYYSFNYFDRTNNWNISSPDFHGNVQTDLTLAIHSIGFQFGYQFIFWKRLSLDLILAGPGIGTYSIKAKLNTSMDPKDEKLLFETLNNYLSERFPGFDKVIAPGDFKKTGTENMTSFGFRYMIMVGFRF